MSRVIKGAIMRGDKPKILESPVLPLREISGEESAKEDAQLAAACSAIIEAHNQKAAACLAAAENQRNDMLAEAAAKAEQLLIEAKVKADLMYETAKQDGLQLGIDEARQAARQEVAEQMQQTIQEANRKAQRVVQLAESEQQEAVLKAEQQIVEIAAALADKIVTNYFAENKEAVVHLVKAALEKVKNQSEITIKVADVDYENVLAAKQLFVAQLDGKHKLTILSDALVKPGGCMIESESGTVDARLKTQLEALKKAMREVM